MKQLFVFFLGCTALLHAQAQSDPLAQFFIKQDPVRIEASLTSLGKQNLVAEKAAYDKLSRKSYQFSPNTAMNYPFAALAATRSEPQSESGIRQNFDSNLKAIPAAQRLFESKKIKWNPNWLIDFSRINWTKILIGASGCTLNTAHLTPVKNQGGCGSCWAFAAAAAFEHNYRMNFGVVTDLSDQDILSCGKACDNSDAGSCSGGWEYKGLEYIKCTGVSTEALYPYTDAPGPETAAATDACLSKDKTYFASGWVKIGDSYPSDAMVKAAILTYGAVTTAVNASGWSGYGGGVMDAYPNGSLSGPTINHAVTIVGWCDTKNAWIVKNSWGTGWGPYRGYCYVKYGHYNINNRVYAVLANP